MAARPVILPNERGPEVRRTQLRPDPKARAKALRTFNRRLARVAKIRARAIEQGKGQTDKTPLQEILRSFTWADLSRMTRIPYVTLTSYFYRYREPSFTNGLKIARALGVHPERFWSYLVSQRRVRPGAPAPELPPGP